MATQKSKKEAPAKRVLVEDLLSILPDEKLEGIASALKADKHVSKFHSSVMFKLVLYSLLNTERISLRVMEEAINDSTFKVLCPAMAEDEGTWAGIRYRLTTLNIDYCRSLYEHVYTKLEEHYGNELIESYHLKRYDSTMISTFSHLLSGMKVGNTANDKTQVKLTVELKGDFLIQVNVHKDQAHLSEEVALKEAIQNSSHEENEICIFDKGIQSRKTFEELDKAKTRFVGRLNTGAKYELLSPFWQDDGTFDTNELEFIQDSVVYLYSSKAKLVKKKFRLVQFRRKADGLVLSFLTNVWALSALTIADIYQRRWDIEVLFRFLKQEMNLTHFVSNNTNAIQVMLYFTMITAMLVLIYKKENDIKSYKIAKIRFYKELTAYILGNALESNDGVEWVRLIMKNYRLRL